MLCAPDAIEAVLQPPLQRAGDHLHLEGVPHSLVFKAWTEPEHFVR
jgi:hypothetical protein